MHIIGWIKNNNKKGVDFNSSSVLDKEAHIILFLDERKPTF